MWLVGCTGCGAAEQLLQCAGWRALDWSRGVGMMRRGGLLLLLPLQARGARNYCKAEAPSAREWRLPAARAELS